MCVNEFILKNSETYLGTITLYVLYRTDEELFKQNICIYSGGEHQPELQELERVVFMYLWP